MIQCAECEHFRRDALGNAQLACDPLVNIKEPECLAKWQLVRIGHMVQAYEATLSIYRKLAPMQEKMFRHMEREIDEIDEADRWKQGCDDSECDDEQP